MIPTAKAWSIAEVGRRSGVTSRTLRHYDAIGLLTPAWADDSGRRYYGQAQLVRLQQVLLLRRLGLPLAAIGAALDRQSPESTVDALREHRDRLLAERDRLDRLVATVTDTIDAIQEGSDMAPEQVFAGFERDPYEAEARQRWGDDAVDRSSERVRGFSPADAEQVKAGYQAVHDGLRDLRAQGAAVTDERVQRLVADHFRLVSLFWDPTAETYRGLGQTYVDDERFRTNIGGGDDDLVTYLRDAMAVYADTQLAEPSTSGTP